jgi:hypothetical protein
MEPSAENHAAAERRERLIYEPRVKIPQDWAFGDAVLEAYLSQQLAFLLPRRFLSGCDNWAKPGWK